MAPTLERARRLVHDISGTSSATEFAEVAIDGLWSLIPADEITFTDIAVDDRRVVVERTKPAGRLPRADVIAYVLELAFDAAPSIRRAVVLRRAEKDFTQAEYDLLVLLGPHLEAGYRRARAAELLTPRELDVLGLVRQGLTNREIARRLEIGCGTVRSHLEHAFKKLGVGTRTAAVAAID